MPNTYAKVRTKIVEFYIPLIVSRELQLKNSIESATKIGVLFRQSNFLLPLNKSIEVDRKFLLGPRFAFVTILTLTQLLLLFDSTSRCPDIHRLIRDSAINQVHSHRP